MVFQEYCCKFDQPLKSVKEFMDDISRILIYLFFVSQTVELFLEATECCFSLMIRHLNLKQYIVGNK